MTASAPSAARDLDLVRGADDADDAAARDLAELHERAADAAGRRVDEQRHARAQAHELEERVVGRERYRGKTRRVAAEKPLGMGKT